MRQPLSWQRGGAVALAVLIVVIIAALILDSGGPAELAPVEAYVEQRSREPVRLLEEMGRSARVVLLADVHGLRGPKRLAAAAVRALAEGPGLDAVLLEVPADEQPYLEAYMHQPEDDATVLLSRPRAIREHDPESREYLALYQAIRSTSDALGPARRIRVIAGDLPDWPPPEGASPEEVVRLYARRAEHMLQRLDEEVFTTMPGARVLVFIDGYLTLQRTRGQIQAGGGDVLDVPWLGELLRQRASADTRTVLVDGAAARPGTSQRLPRYRGTELYRPLRRLRSGAMAVPLLESFPPVRDAVLDASSPGLRLEVLPRGYTLGDAADGYVLLPGG